MSIHSSSALRVTPVETPNDMETFIRFPWEIYRDDPYWVPPFLSEQRALFTTHPFHQHSKVCYFLARRGGKVIGRIAGIVNHNHNAHWNDKVGFFGFYEVLEDRAASDALLSTAADFVYGEGLRAMRGPANFSTNEECGLLVDGWGVPVVMMTYNPRYYVDFIEHAGYMNMQDLYAYTVNMADYAPDGTGVHPKILRVMEKVRQRLNITIRPINMRDFKTEAKRFKGIYNAAWQHNWGFVPLTEAELEHEIYALKPLVDPKTMFFAEVDGRPVGAILPLPDFNQVLHKAYPHPDVPEWWTKLKALYWWKLRHSITCIRGFAGGVIEEYRGRGIDAILFMESFRAGLQRGYKTSEVSWVLGSNSPMCQTAENFGGKIYRTYRLYEKAL